MKSRNPLTALTGAAPLVLGSCSGEEVNAALGKAKDLDVSSLNIDEMQSKFQSVGSQLSAKLGEITDLASAKEVVAEIQPMLASATQLKTALGKKLPNLESLGSTVQELKAKFADNEMVLGVLRPVLEKIQTLLA